MKYPKRKHISTFGQAIEDSYFYPEGNNLGPVITMRHDGAIDYQLLLPKEYYKHKIEVEGDKGKS